MRSARFSFVLTSCFLLVGCSLDSIDGSTSTAWELAEDSPPLPPFELTACHPAFVTGPVWAQVADRRAASRESEWIAVLGTTKNEAVLDARSHEVDYSQKMARIEAMFADLEIEVLSNDRDLILVVAGAPGAILEALERACLLSSFDLTGFHCDCAPAQCEAARTCQVVTGHPNGDLEQVRKSYSRMLDANPLYEPIIACQDDYDFGGGTYAGRQQRDLRGAEWFVSHEGGVASWRASTCQDR